MISELQRLGWTEQQLPVLPPDHTLVRVVAEHRGAYRVAGEGGSGWAELRGRAFVNAADKRDLPTVGDWIVVASWDRSLAETGAAVIDRILPRRTLMVRKAAGEQTLPQPLAANVDVALIVTSVTVEHSPRRLERYLALAGDAGVLPVVIVNKIDLVEDAAGFVERVGASVPGCQVVAVSALRGDGLDELRRCTGERTCVLLGSSGVGKSSLLNQLMRAPSQPVSATTGGAKGRHTTTHRELFVLPYGGTLIDTPGMRELGLWLDDEIAEFSDLEALAAQCRFSDCGHGPEPGCAVREAVARGELGADRVAALQKLVAERNVQAGRKARVDRHRQATQERTQRQVGSSVRAKKPPGRKRSPDSQ
jgi:ribosome biogenesis GTPase